NFLPHKVVAAITPLGRDHLAQLGPDVTNIAWHKAGIMRPGVTTFVAPQPEGSEVIDVIEARAKEKGVEIVHVDVAATEAELKEWAEKGEEAWTEPPVLRTRAMRENLAVARAVVDEFLRKTIGEGERLSIREVAKAAEMFNWPGRFQVFEDGEL